MKAYVWVEDDAISAAADLNGEAIPLGADFASHESAMRAIRRYLKARGVRIVSYSTIVLGTATHEG